MFYGQIVCLHIELFLKFLVLFALSSLNLFLKFKDLHYTLFSWKDVHDIENKKGYRVCQTVSPKQWYLHISQDLLQSSFLSKFYFQF